MRLRHLDLVSLFSAAVFLCASPAAAQVA